MADIHFQGPAALTLDSKGRLAIPARHRDLLDKAAIKALSACKFKPGTKDGAVAQTWTKVDYSWKL